ARPEISTLSLPDALPIYRGRARAGEVAGELRVAACRAAAVGGAVRAAVLRAAAARGQREAADESERCERDELVLANVHCESFRGLRPGFTPADVCQRRT